MLREAAGLAGPDAERSLKGKDGPWKKTDKVVFHAQRMVPSIFIASSFGSFCSWLVRGLKIW